MIKNKLKSEDGATMILAVFAMLVITAVSAMLIHSAFSAAQNHVLERNQRQLMLTVSSVAYMFRDSIDQDSVICSSEESYQDFGEEALEPVKGVLLHWVQILSTTPSRESCEAVFQINAEELDAVNVAVCLNREKLIIVFSADENTPGYCMSLCFDIDINGDSWNFNNPTFLKGNSLGDAA